MTHLYKASMWQGASGSYYVADVANLSGIASKWWVPCRIINADPASFLQMLITDFNAEIVACNLDKDFILYSWSSERDAHKYELWINKKAREKNYRIN